MIMILLSYTNCRKLGYVSLDSSVHSTHPEDLMMAQAVAGLLKG